MTDKDLISSDLLYKLYNNSPLVIATTNNLKRETINEIKIDDMIMLHLNSF